MLVSRLLLGIPLVALLGGCFTERRSGVFAEFTSPNGGYTARLAGNPGYASMFGVGHVIRADVLKGGVPLIIGREIHYADFMDSSFDQDYCGQDWPRPNVLRFQACHPSRLAPHRTTDTLVIRNRGQQASTFLQVSTDTDMVLLFELSAGADVELTVSGRTDLNWFHVEGVWADGTKVPSAAPHFRDLPKAGSEFEIVVGPQAVSVTRRDVPSNRPLQPTSGASGAS